MQEKPLFTGDLFSADMKSDLSVASAPEDAQSAFVGRSNPSSLSSKKGLTTQASYGGVDAGQVSESWLKTFWLSKPEKTGNNRIPIFLEASGDNPHDAGVFPRRARSERTRDTAGLPCLSSTLVSTRLSRN